jgi:NAD(P)H-dependent flavin oxidoreductase YrpB (nitropropane dioxygenase family)
VAAAGGIADARGVVAVLALGAQAAVLGTRFLASAESDAHAEYKRRVADAGEGDTIRTTLFGRGWPDAPHRVLRTPFVERGDASGTAPVGMMQLGAEPVPILPGSPAPPTRATSGDIASMALYAGQGVGLVNEVRPAGEIVRGLIAGAERILERMARGA